MKSIGYKIKERRIALNLTQKELSKLTGIGQSTISEWEKDTYEPTANSIKLLCISLDISADNLLDIKRD